MTVRLPYIWAASHNTLVYVNSRVSKGPQLCFWNFVTEQLNVKPSNHVTGICANDKHFLLSTETDDARQHAIVLYDSIGTPVASKTIELHPKCLTMTATYGFATDGCLLFVWVYRTQQVCSPNCSDSIENDSHHTAQMCRAR